MEDTASHMERNPTKKNIRVVNKTVLKIFDNLYKNSEVKKNESCISLVRYLAESHPPNEEKDLPADFKYCLSRLVRGLGGNLVNCRKNNFTALVAILHSFPSITLETYMQFLDKELNGQDVSEGEEGGVFSGQILAFGAAIRGGLFERSTIEDKTNIVKSLVKYSKKKSYLSAVAAPFLLDLVKSSNESVFLEAVWPVLKEEVVKPWTDQTLDSLLLLLGIVFSHPNTVTNKQTQKWLGTPLLSLKSLHHFAEKLLVLNTGANLEHPLYEEFCNVLCLPENFPLLKKFWTVDVSKEIISSPRNKEVAILHLLTLLSTKISRKEDAYTLVTSSVLQTISRILQSSRADRERFPELNLKAREALNILEKALVAAEVSDDVRLGVLRECLFSSKTFIQGNQAGTHLVSLLENKLSEEGVKELAELFQKVVEGIPQVDGQHLTIKDRMYAAQHLSRLTCLQSCCKEVDWKVKQLVFLSEHGIFKHRNNIISAELAASLKQCFFRALDQKFASLENIMQVLSGIVNHLNNLISSQNKSKLTLRVPFDPEALSSWEKMIKTVCKLERRGKSIGKEVSVEQIFHTLFLFMGLELLADSAMASEALQELHECHARLKKVDKARKNSGEPQWVEVTVELLLSLLSHDSHMTRTVVSTVFPTLSKYLTASSFHQILKVLDPAQGENPLSSVVDIDDESSDDGSELSEDDVKIGNGKKKNVNMKGGSDEENIVESEEDSENEEEEEDDPYEEGELLIDKLRMDLHQALGDSAALTDTESVDLDEIDEEEGRRMDTALGQAFKSYKQSKPGSKKKSKEKIKTEEIVMHFRTRVLDLVELYLSHEPSMALCLEAMTPLLNLCAFCSKNNHRKDLEGRAKNLLVKLTAVKKFSSCEGVDDNYLAEKLKSLTGKGIKTSSTFLSLADLVVECCIFVVRCSEYIETQTSTSHKSQFESPVIDVYKSLLLEFFTKRDTLLPYALFKAVFQLNWTGCWILLPVVVDYALNCDVRVYCRRQALFFLTVVFRNNALLACSKTSGKQELLSIARRLMEHTIELMNSLSSGENPAEQSRNSKQFLAEIMHSLAQILSRPELESVDKSSLVTALSALSSAKYGVTKDIRKALSSLSKQFSGSHQQDLMKTSKRLRLESERSLESGEERNNGLESVRNKVSHRKKIKANKSINGSNHITNEPNSELGTLPERSQGLSKKLRRGNAVKDGLEGISSGTFDDLILNGTKADGKRQGKPMVNGSSSSLIVESKFKRKPHNSSLEVDASKKKKKKSQNTMSKIA